MKTKLVIAMLLAGSSMFAETRFSVGVGVGGYGHAAPPMVAYVQHGPGPGYYWIDGYWDHVGPRRFWREGYWAAPQYRREHRFVERYDRDRHDHWGAYENSYNQNNDWNRSNDNRSRNSFNENRSGSNNNQFNNGSGRR